MVFRRTSQRLGAATSNFYAPPNSGRWVNPPHQWTMADCVFPLFLIGGPPVQIGIYVYHSWFDSSFSHYTDKNYYPAWPYSKEFIHKYKRMERWRWY
jgi:hypothetical protein